MPSIAGAAGATTSLLDALRGCRYWLLRRVFAEQLQNKDEWD